MRAAFYAPLKSPEHPLPSGDRTMARLLLRALARAGVEPDLASGLRTLDRAGEPAAQAALRDASHEEAERLLALYARQPELRPDLWFTYHCYYKAPDWLGPLVADALGIPYLVAEASRAGKRAGGPWDLGHRGAEAAIARADRIFVMTAADREALARDGHAGRLVSLPPFIDLDEWACHPRPELARRVEGKGVQRDDDAAQRHLVAAEGPGRASGAASPQVPCAGSPRCVPCGNGPAHLVLRPGMTPGSAAAEAPLRLLTVAMMRPGDKLASYRILADVLARLSLPFTLDVAGDGEARPEVEALLAQFGQRIRYHGAVEGRAALSALYRSADLLLWPAVNEAYGMAFLEAQGHGLPVAAGSYGGVASVVRHGETGVLCPPGDAAALAEAVGRIAAGRERMAAAAARFVAGERGLDAAAAILRETIAGLVQEGVP